MDDVLERRHALLVVKGLDLARRTFSGIASTSDLDRQGHAIDPDGVTFRNPLPLLFHHKQEHPIGTVTLYKTAAGIAFDATMPVLTDAGPLKDRIDEAWQSIKERLITGVSIGLRALEKVYDAKSDVLKILKSEILELSLVTIPANAQASILTVKSLAALGPNSSGVADPPLVRATKAAPVMTTKEQITALENTRAAKVGMMTDLMTAAAAAGVTLDASQAERYDALDLEVKSVSADLARYRTLEQTQLLTATRIEPATGNGNGNDHAAAIRGGGQITVKANVLPGTAFIRYCQAKAFAAGDSMRAISFADQWKDSTPEVAMVLKAAVAAGNTTDATWAGPLAVLKPLADEFLEYLRPATVIGNIPNLHKVPFNVSVPSQTGGGTYAWVGQGAPKPVGALQFGTLTLGITKCAGIIAITEELARVSSPSAEEAIRKDMVNGIAHFLDQEFTNPTKAPVANVSPGSITNGVTPLTTAGTTPANARTDIQALLAALTAAGLSAKGAVLLMSESNALALGSSLNPLGQPLFANLNANGGSANGVTVVTSQVLGSNVIALAPDAIFLADDGGVTIDVSREASVQMDSAPMNPADATVVFTSFWQSNLVGLRAERFINWKKARAGCVQYLVGSYTAG